MKLLNGKIIFIDFVESDSKEKLDEDLRALTGLEKNPQSKNWAQMSDTGGTYEDWKLDQIPSELSFFKSITIRVLQFSRFKFGYMIITQGELIDEKIREFDSSENNNIVLEELRKKFWNFCKENIKGVVVKTVKDFLFLDGISINHFVVKFEHTREILGASWTKGVMDSEIREHQIIKKFGMNNAGLLSYFRPYDTKFTLVGQHNSVASGSDYDYSGISIIDFLDNEKQFVYDEMFYHEHERILKLLFSYLWFKYRFTYIPLWKNEITELSKQIKNSGDSFDQENLNRLLKNKGLFVVHATSIIDEYRSVKKYLEFDEGRKDDFYWQEFPILESPNFPNLVGGIKENLMQSVNWYKDTIKEEFDVLYRQFEDISSHVTDVVSTKNAISSLKLEKSNQKLQSKLFWLTVIIACITAVLIVFAALEFDSNTKTSQLLIKIGSLIDALLSVETTALFSEYKDFELELEYSFNPMFREELSRIFGSMSTKNYGKYDMSLIHQWDVTRYCDKDGNIIDVEPIVYSSTSYGINRNEGQTFYFLHDKIFPVQNITESFELFIVAKGFPKSPKGTLDEPERRSTTRIQFDLVDNIWMPRWNENSLDCNHLEDYPKVKLDTKNDDHFHKIE